MQKIKVVIWIFMMSVMMSGNCFATDFVQARQDAQDAIDMYPHVSFSDLQTNEADYFKQTVVIEGDCYYSNGDTAFIADENGNTISIYPLATYRLIPDTHYTMVGIFAGMTTMQDANDQTKPMAVLVEVTHLPYGSEVGL
jgi:hypothetical protein